MKEMLDFKEYDLIMGNEKYKNEKNKYKYLKEPYFHELIEFIQNFNVDESDVDALELMNLSYHRDVKDVVSIKNYVGLIQMKSGYKIQILPKIAFLNDEDKDNSETKKIFLKMLRSMKEFQNKNFNDADVNFDKMNLFEIFISMYIQEVTNLIKLGLKSTYINKEENLNTVRGKICINKHIRENFIHKERIFCEFDEYEINRPENKIIKSTLLKLLKESNNYDNIKKLNKLLTYFEFVEPSQNYDADFSKISIVRDTKAYELLMKWSKVFLKNNSFTPFSGNSGSRALLFPMEKLFEAYVAEAIRKETLKKDWKVSIQSKGCFLFDEPVKKFAIIPDIVIRRDDDSKIILDTKWKLLDKNKKNYGISQNDMYQMYAYAKKYENTSDVWLIYPLTEKVENQENIMFKSKDGVRVNVFFVDLTKKIEDSVRELFDKFNF